MRHLEARRDIKERLDELAESHRTDLKEPRRLRAGLERMATVGVELSVDDDQGSEVRRADGNTSVDELLREDAESLCRELDDPQEVRRRFDRIVEQLEREGIDGPFPIEFEESCPHT